MEAKRHLRDSLAALSEYVFLESAPENESVLYEVGRSFYLFIKALYVKTGFPKTDNDVALFIKQLQKWKRSDEHSARPFMSRSKRDNTSGVSLSDIKGRESLCKAFPKWTWEFDIPRKANDILWEDRGLQGSLAADVKSLSDEAVAVLADVCLRSLYLQEMYTSDGDNSINGRNERKLYMHVCTLLRSMGKNLLQRVILGRPVSADSIKISPLYH